MKICFRGKDGRDVTRDVPKSALVPKGWTLDIEDTMLEGKTIMRDSEGAEPLPENFGVAL